MDFEKFEFNTYASFAVHEQKWDVANRENKFYRTFWTELMSSYWLWPLKCWSHVLATARRLPTSCNFPATFDSDGGLTDFEEASDWLWHFAKGKCSFQCNHDLSLIIHGHLLLAMWFVAKSFVCISLCAVVHTTAIPHLGGIFILKCHQFYQTKLVTCPLLSPNCLTCEMTC